MNARSEAYADTDIRDMLADTQTIAMIGASDDASRASNSVMRYLQNVGYRVIPINPRLAGRQLFGETAYTSLEDIPETFEMVDVFRRVDAVPGIVDDVVPLIAAKGVRYLWLQLDIIDEPSAARARKAGLDVVMDRCLRIEHARLIGVAD